MMKILIVEDEILVARMYQKMVQSGGFEVKVALNGAEGIEKAKKLKPDLILMDIMMPVMNGIQALEKLKEDAETQNIPVVMLTNMSGERDSELSISKGATAFWVKKDLNAKTLKENLLAIINK